MPPRRLLFLAGKMAYREVRASPAKFLATLTLMAVATGGVFAARGITAGFEAHLAEQMREWIAADAAVAYFGSAPTPEQWAAVRELGPGIRATLVTEGGALASSSAAADPATVALKAVDAATYPFYGHLGLQSGRALSQVLDSSSAVVSPDLQNMLGVHAGDAIYIRGTVFRICDIITSEPDRFLPAQVQSARVIISQDGLDRTSLFRFGPAYYRLLFRTPPETDVATILGKLEDLFPQAEVVDHSAPTPQFTATLQGFLPFLDVLAFLTLAAGCIAIAVTAYFDLLARLDAIAMLKAIGATSSQVIAIYWFRILLAAAAGIGLGIVGGRVLEAAIIALVSLLLDIHLKAQTGAGVALETGGLCLLAAVAAPWLPLLKIRTISVLRMQRRDVGEKERLDRRYAHSTALYVATLGVVGAATLLFSRIVPAWSARVYFLAGFCAVMVAVAGLAGLPLPRSLSRNWSSPRWIAWPVRYGVANIFRYRQQSSLVVVALAAGTALMVTAAGGEKQFTGRVLDAIPFRMPQLLVVNVSDSQRFELTRFLARQPGVSRPPSFVPTSYLTLVRAGGRTLSELRILRHAWIKRTWEATCFDRPPERFRIEQGRWWNGPPQQGAIALDKDIAASLGVGIGSQLEFLSDGQILRLRVAALVDIPPSGQVWGNGIFLDCGALKPTAFNGGIVIDPPQLSRVRRALRERFPDVTPMLVGEVVERIQQLGIEAVRALRVLAVLVICIALSLLVAVIHSARASRISEVAILRALGARGNALLALLAAEYMSLGAVAGMLGAAAGCATVIAVSWRITGKWRFALDFGQIAVAIGGTALLAAAVGLAFSVPLLRRRPLEILRRQ